MLKSIRKNNLENQTTTHSIQFFRYLISLALVLFACVSVMADKPTVNPAAVLDFDGDGKTDLAVVRDVVSRGRLHWYILSSQTNQMIPPLEFGISDDIGRPIPADYDGDGKWDIAVFRAGTSPGIPLEGYFYVWQSSTNSMRVFRWGYDITDDANLTQDFDGDRKADPTVVRCSDERLVWYSLMSATNYQERITTFGYCRRNVIYSWDRKDRAIRGDFDGDGKADIAVYRSYNFWNRSPSSTFHVLRSSDGKTQSMGLTFPGRPTCNVVQADFDGDGKTDFATVSSQWNGNYHQIWWYWIRSSDGRFDSAPFGYRVPGSGYGDGAIVGDYDGDGMSDLAIIRDEPPARYFYINRSRDGFIVIHWGMSSLENVLAGFFVI